MSDAPERMPVIYTELTSDNGGIWAFKPFAFNHVEWVPHDDYAAAIARAEKAEAALRPFAEYMQSDNGRMDRDNLGNDLPDNQGVGWVYLTHGDFRKATAALSKGDSHE
jgi:hypothetical protein